MENDLNTDVLKTIHTLLVSNDEETSKAVEGKFQAIFASFTHVNSAEEAVERLNLSNYELIITDYHLPVMDGLDFVKTVKAKYPNMPIIMMSDYLDMQFLVTTMNAGVTQFVAKPIQLRLFRNAIHLAVERTVIDNLQRKAKIQELEILQYREASRKMQQELAFRKELKIIRNDVFMRYYDPYGGSSELGGWNLNVYYASKDFLSGDSYACRKLPNNDIILFIADAMGKGISASITSIQAVSLVNYILNEMIDEDCFDFSLLMKKYTSFVKDNLLDEEVMCSLFLHLDFKRDKMYYSSFAMPRLAIGYADGRNEKIISNNLPIMNFIEAIHIGEKDIKDVTRILMMSDGMIESQLGEGGIYSPYLRGDFISSPFLSNLEKKIKLRVPKFDDDTTMIFLMRPFACPVYKSSLDISAKYTEVSQSHLFLSRQMEENGIEPAKYQNFFAAFSEAVMNAYEHGSLNIDRYEKHDLLEKERYEHAILELEELYDRKITFSFGIYAQNSFRYMMVSVRDEGAGYPPETFKHMAEEERQFCGRGVRMINHYTDCVFLSEDRREIFLAKNL